MSSKNTKTLNPWIIKSANVEDAATGDCYEVFMFRKMLGFKGTLRIERDKARDSHVVLLALAKRNAILPYEDKQAERLIAEAIRSEPRRHRLHVRRLGWLPGRKGFALKRTVLGAQGGIQTLRPPLWVNDRQVGVLKCKGTLEQWQQHVALRVVHSTRLMLVLSAAFAAPLVGISGLQNFGINIFGRAKVGKTTALLVGASAIGIGTERDLPNWNTTSNAFLETARGFNDLLVPVNEVGLLAGKRRDAYAPIRERIYTFSEGRDRARLSSSTMATTWASSSWQGIFASTSEYSFNDYAAFSGEIRGSGEFARCLDVAAVRKGHTTIFDSYPKDVETKRRKRWARTQLTELRENCARFHGTALEPYLTHLISVSGQLPKKAKKHCSEFMKAVRAMRLGGALEHAGQNFALIYAGGCMAIEANVLPWTEAAVFQAVEACFVAAVQDILGHTSPLTRGRAILRTRLQSGEILQARAGETITPERYVGFWREEGGIRTYTLHAKAFRQWFDSRAQAVAVLQWLYEQGDLLADRGKLRPSPKSAQWAERACRWPGDKVVKSIRLRDPFIPAGPGTTD
jgi:putative DNA primase/helicase